MDPTIQAMIDQQVRLGLRQPNVVLYFHSEGVGVEVNDIYKGFTVEGKFRIIKAN